MKTFTRTSGIIGVLMAALAVLATGCERDEPVRAYAAPKDPPKPGPPIKWTVPAGWKQLPPQQMRYAAYAVSQEHPEAVLAITPLPPSPLLPNVNRWEEQLGLPESPESQLDKVVRHVDLPAGHVDFVELLGPEKPGVPRQRLLGAMLEQSEERMWFFKLTGPDPVVAGQKENFEAFLRSVQLNPPASGGAGAGETAHAAPGPAAPAGPTAPSPARGDAHAGAAQEKPQKLAKWTAPPDWKQDPQTRSMRTLSYLISSADGRAEVAVFHLPVQNVNQATTYVNIWRQEVGVSPAQQLDAASATKVTVAGKEASLFEFTGPEGAPQPQKRALIAMAERGQDIWFFKLSGDAPVVSAQRDAFQKFLASVEFGG